MPIPGSLGRSYGSPSFLEPISRQARTAQSRTGPEPDRRWVAPFALAVVVREALVTNPMAVRVALAQSLGKQIHFGARTALRCKETHPDLQTDGTPCNRSEGGASTSVGKSIRSQNCEPHYDWVVRSKREVRGLKLRRATPAKTVVSVRNCYDARKRLPDPARPGYVGRDR